jgi:hypothetical protein
VAYDIYGCCIGPRFVRVGEEEGVEASSRCLARERSKVW